MKHFYSLFLLMFCVLVIGAPLPAKAAPTPQNFVAANMVQNGSFENGAAFWYLPQKGSSVGNAQAHIGASSLRLTQADSKSAAATATQFLPVSPGDVLTATVWVKGQGLAPTLNNRGASLAVDAYAANGTRINRASSMQSAGTFDWKLVDLNYTVPANADKVLLKLSSGEGVAGTAWFDDIEVRIDAQTYTSTNLLSQAGFEEGLEDWGIAPELKSLTRRDTTVKRSGEASLRASNTDTTVYLTIPRKLPTFTAGDMLHFSVWVKGENVTSAITDKGAGIYVEFYDVNNKYITGSYPQPLVGTFDWTHVSGKVAIPSNVGRVVLGVYMRRQTVGTAWFDDVELQVESKPALRVFFEYPNYHGPLTNVLAKPWQAEAQVSPASTWTKQAMSVESHIFDVQGKLVSHASLSVPAVQGAPKITVQPPANLANGAYFWRLAFSDPTGAVHRFHLPVQVAAQAPAVALDSEGFTRVNGNRFFPLGLYLAAAPEADLKRIAAAGFNTVLSYNYGGGKDYQEYLDRAQAHGLKVIFSLKDMYALHSNQILSEVQQMAVDRIVALREKPALLAWYINDELPITNLPMLEERYTKVKTLDSNHPVYQVLGETTYLDFYHSSTDVIGTDPYPIGRDANFQQTTQFTNETIASARGAKGVWMVPQMHDRAVYSAYANRPSHPPSLDEMRNQAYQALIGGAKGLIFYSYFDLWFADSKRTSSEAAFEKRWPSVTAMATEIKNLTPALLEGTPVAFTTSPNTRLPAKVLKFKNQLLVLAANPLTSAQTLVLTIPAGWKPTQEQQSGMSGSVNGTTLTISLPAGASGVFSLNPA